MSVVYALIKGDTSDDGAEDQSAIDVSDEKHVFNKIFKIVTTNNTLSVN